MFGFRTWALGKGTDWLQQRLLPGPSPAWSSQCDGWAMGSWLPGCESEQESWCLVSGHDPQTWTWWTENPREDRAGGCPTYDNLEKNLIKEAYGTSCQTPWYGLIDPGRKNHMRIPLWQVNQLRPREAQLLGTQLVRDGAGILTQVV